MTGNGIRPRLPFLATRPAPWGVWPAGLMLRAALLAAVALALLPADRQTGPPQAAPALRVAIGDPAALAGVEADERHPWPDDPARFCVALARRAPGATLLVAPAAPAMLARWRVAAAYAGLAFVALAPPAPAPVALRLIAVALPRVVHAPQPVLCAFTVESAAPGTFRLSVRAGAHDVAARTLAVPAGRSAHELTLADLPAGEHLIELRLAPDDRVAPPPDADAPPERRTPDTGHRTPVSYRAPLTVLPAPRLLLLHAGPEADPSTAEWFAELGFPVATQTASSAFRDSPATAGSEGSPAAAPTPDQTAAVVIADLAALAALDDEGRRRLAAGVTADGRGLLVFDGGRPAAVPEPLAALLPVEPGGPERRRARAPLATVLLVIDSSGSMALGAKMPWARRAAEASIRALDPDDLLGLISFDAGARLLVAPARGADLQRSIAVVRRLEARGPDTRLQDALDLALRVFAERPTPVRHLIVLSDGEDRSLGAWEGYYQRLRAAEVTITAVDIGATASSTLPALCDRVNDAHWGGYFREQDLPTIPGIFTRAVLEQTRRLERPPGEPPGAERRERALFAVQPAGESTLQDGPERDFPPLARYALWRQRPGGARALSVDGDHPLLVLGRAGAGRAAAWATGFARADLGPWYRWPDAAPYFRRLVHLLAEGAKAGGQGAGGGGLGEVPSSQTADRQLATRNSQLATRNPPLALTLTARPGRADAPAALDLRVFDAAGRPVAAPVLTVGDGRITETVRAVGAGRYELPWPAAWSPGQWLLVEEAAVGLGAVRLDAGQGEGAGGLRISDAGLTPAPEGLTRRRGDAETQRSLPAVPLRDSATPRDTIRRTPHSAIAHSPRIFWALAAALLVVLHLFGLKRWLGPAGC